MFIFWPAEGIDCKCINELIKLIMKLFRDRLEWYVECCMSLKFITYEFNMFLNLLLNNFNIDLKVHITLLMLLCLENCKLNYLLNFPRISGRLKLN